MPYTYRGAGAAKCAAVKAIAERGERSFGHAVAE